MPKVVKGARVEWGGCSRTVLLDVCGIVLSYQDNIIAVGSWSKNIIILSAITGSQVAVLSGHTDWVRSLTFSSDGRSLVSGSDDKTVKLWDIQTGGVARTFYGHLQEVSSVSYVSISVDCIRIASGSHDSTILLWDIQTGQCLCTIEQESSVDCVSFSPFNPKHIFSVSGSKIWEWDFDGHQIPSTYDGSYIIFSPDHTQFALCDGVDITVQSYHSGKIVAKFQTTDSTKYYCFSPDGKLIAAAAGKTVYVWDITSQGAHLIKTFTGHTHYITSIVFSSPSSLVSTSYDKSVKFWEIGTLSTDNVTANAKSTPLSSARIESISLQARDRIAISSDSAGVIKTWDISTGICKASFQTPAGISNHGDAKLIGDRLVFVWYKDNQIHIWETQRGKLLQTLDMAQPNCLRISGDGSKIIGLFGETIRAWSMWTWELVCEIKSGLGGDLYLDPLCTYSPRVWIHSKGSSAQEGWDFGTSGSSPAPFDPSTGRPDLAFVHGMIKGAVTRKRVFQLSGKYANHNDVQWDGRFLVAGYDSGEVLILDFHCVPSQVV